MQVEVCCQALLAQLLPKVDSQRDGLCIDVGVGTFAFYCELFAKLGFQSIAVEPLPVATLQETCDRHNITLVESCLAEVDGVQTLHVGTYQGSENLNLCSLVSDWWGASSQTVQVPSLRLAQLLSNVDAQKVTCLKLDVEGAESAIIRQFVELPDSLLPSAVMFEYGGGDTRQSGKQGWSEKFLNATMECLHVLKKYGYDFSIIIDDNSEAEETVFNLQSSHLEPEQIFLPGARWGNIISFRREIEPSASDITRICTPYRSNRAKKFIEKTGETKIIEDFISSGNIVFDIGANVGDWSKAVLTKYPDAQIHLFEPVPQNYQTLLQNLVKPIANGQLLLNNFAVSNREEVRTFYFYEDRPSWSTFYRKFDVEKQYKLNPPKSFPVLTATLDRYVQLMGIDRINFLKIDTEGGELEVLSGAKELLRRGRVDCIQFEYGGNFLDANITLEQIFNYLQRFKYSLLKILPNGLEYLPHFLPHYEDFKYSNFLAVNERFRSTLLREAPKMLDLSELCHQNSIVPRGIIHIGAHEGQELECYRTMGVQKVLFIEANPAIFERLQANLAGLPEVISVNCAISNQNGTTALHVTSLDLSSSLLPLKRVSEYYPNIRETEQITVQSRTLDKLLQELQLNPADFNLLNIDIQGAELMALQGATDTLKYVEAIYTEVNYEELYEGCVLINQLDEFLEMYGFQRMATTTPYHPSWGDAFYLRKPEITMSTLGKNGRFANQIFQYAFLKIYAQEHDLQVKTPAWIGQYLFGHNDPPISRQLPVVPETSYKLSEAVIPNAKQPFKNVDFWGYFQYNTKYYAPHKEYFRSLFKPVPEVQTKMQAVLNRLRSRGKTIVGLHLRRGDYGYKYYFIAPSEWYKEWLRGLWETLDEPVLFIASDEPEKAIADFSEYNPLIAKDLGIQLPEAEFYPDFYLLSLCDIVAISNSSFSFAACLLNEQGKFFFRPHLPTKKLVPFDPWNSETVFRDAEVDAPASIGSMPLEGERAGTLNSEEAIAESLFYISLNEINLVIFPDWSQPEESLALDLEKVLKSILTHPDKSRMALLINTNNISDEDANLALSGVAMNLLLQEDLDVTDVEVSLVGELSPKQWESLLPCLHVRLVLENENQQALLEARVDGITTCELDRFSVLRADGIESR